MEAVNNAGEDLESIGNSIADGVNTAVDEIEETIEELRDLTTVRIPPADEVTQPIADLLSLENVIDLAQTQSYNWKTDKNKVPK